MQCFEDETQNPALDALSDEQPLQRMQGRGRDKTILVFNLQSSFGGPRCLHGQGDHCCITFPGTVPWGIRELGCSKGL